LLPLSVKGLKVLHTRGHPSNSTSGSRLMAFHVCHVGADCQKAPFSLKRTGVWELMQLTFRHSDAMKTPWWWCTYIETCWVLYETDVTVNTLCIRWSK